LFALFGFGVRSKVNSFQMRNFCNGRANRKLFIRFLELEKLRDQRKWNQYWRCCWSSGATECRLFLFNLYYNLFAVTYYL